MKKTVEGTRKTNKSNNLTVRNVLLRWTALEFMLLQRLQYHHPIRHSSGMASRNLRVLQVATTVHPKTLVLWHRYQLVNVKKFENSTLAGLRKLLPVLQY
jgi:hypothetical protein